MNKELLQQALKVLHGCLEHPDAADAIAALESAIAQPEQLDFEIVSYQFQWTNPAEYADPDGALHKWEEVVPGRNQTVQQKMDELLAYSYSGKPTYRVRVLYTPTNIAKPVPPASEE